MKKLILSMLVSALTILSFGSTVNICCDTSEMPKNYVEHFYKVKMYLNIPQVVDNMSSLGKRVYKREKITGWLGLVYDLDEEYEYGSTMPHVRFYGLENKTVKTSTGGMVSYEGYENSDAMITRFNYIGDNKNEVFSKVAWNFAADLAPSYKKGEIVTEDNSLYLFLAGKGSSKNSKYGRFVYRLDGYVAGTQGCACAEYGHKSPTRLSKSFGVSGIVVDVASVWGHMKATWSYSCINGSFWNLSSYYW